MQYISQYLTIEVILIVVGLLICNLTRLLCKLLKEYVAQRLAIKEERESMTDGSLAMLRTLIIEYHDKWVGRGYNTPHGLDSYLRMHNAYKKLGGNGLIGHLHDEIMQLPVRKKGENG